MRAWAVLLLVTAGLSGCLGGQDAPDGGLDEGAVQPTGAEAGMGLDDQQVSAPVVFDQSTASHEVGWENGTFQVTEHSYPKGMVTGLAGEYDPDRRTIDLTPMIPQGVPVILTAEIQADLEQGDVDIWIDAPDEEVWAATHDTPYGGYSAIEIVLLHTSSEPVTLNVRYDEIDHSESFDYTLRYAAHVDPGLLPAGVPVGLEVPDAATGLQIDLVRTEEQPAVMLWDPQDIFLGRLAPTGDRLIRVLEPEDPRGEHVVMLAEGSGPARVSLLGIDQAPGELRPLTQVFEDGPGVEAGPGETEVAWSFQVDQVPLQAGIFWSGSEVSQDTQASLASPAADLIGLDISDGPWLQAGFGITTAMGADGLTTGSYEAHVSFGESLGPSGMTANHVLVFYDRGR